MIKINKELENIRHSIDNINNQIAALLTERVELVKRVGQIKKQKKNFYVPERENFIFKSLSEKFSDLDTEIMKKIFTEIISGCRSYEKIFDVGVIETPYSLTALHGILGSFVKHHFFKNIADLEKEFSNLDYALFNLDVQTVSFVEKTEDIFIINYCDYENTRFFLFGTTENTNILSGKMGFLMKKNNFAKIKDNLYNHLYSTQDISSENIYIEINFDENNEFTNMENIKKIFSVPYKYLGIFPDNNF